MGHSMASAILGLVGQPRLQKYVQENIGATGVLGQSGCADSRLEPAARWTAQPAGKGAFRSCSASLQKRLSLHGRLPARPPPTTHHPPPQLGSQLGCRGREAASEWLHLRALSRTRPPASPAPGCEPSPPPPPGPTAPATDRARLHLLARTNLIASAVVSPIYVVVTNPLSRLEVIMQTSSMQNKGITTMEVCPAPLSCPTHPPSPPPPSSTTMKK